MKIILNKKYLSQNPEQFLRQTAGYAHIHSHHTGHDSYVRRLSRDHYPRFHVYVQLDGERVIFDLHLDQKKTSYEGSHSHNAEYEGETVAREVTRIKELIKAQIPSGVI